MMLIDDLTGNGYTRQWSLSTAGQPVCVLDALPPGDTSAALAVSQNAAVRDMVAAVEAFEAAQRVPGPPDNGEPRRVQAAAKDGSPAVDGDGHPVMIDNPAWALLPRTIETTGPGGVPTTAPDPRWLAYDAAQATIAAATEATKALATIRAGEPPKGDDPLAPSPAWLAWEAAGPAVDAAMTAATATNTDAQLPALKTVLAQTVNELRDGHLYGGFKVPAEVSAALAGKVLQTRPEDQPNWLTSQAAYGAAIAGGLGAVMGATFRAADNSSTVLSFAAGMQVLLAMAAWGQSVYARSWALKDQIAAAATVATLNAIDVQAGWP